MEHSRGEGSAIPVYPLSEVQNDHDHQCGSFATMNDDPRFQHHAIDRPRTTVCPSCERVIPLPTTEPLRPAAGVAGPPQLESFTCPECGLLIFLWAVADEERLRDADAHAIREDDE